MRKLILRNHQSPGDIVMLTAAVRDLHIAYPNRFITDVRTPCPALWEHNSYITAIADDDPDAEVIECHYPLIHHSNTRPVHFVEAFTDFLSRKLELPIPSAAFKGDIHLSNDEKSWISQVQEITGNAEPFWLLASGGKFDFTIKWWSPERYQQVVDALQGRVQFVQIGEKGHHHPPLNGVIDLRGKTDLRQLVRLVYHATGVLTPVSLLMHLAAAVEVKPGTTKGRAGVVIAGGREPVNWEAYPQHQFLHTIGALSCCKTGGCWRSRTLPLGDGDDKDQPINRCVDVVGSLPRCMDMITVNDVVRHIEYYL